VRLGEILVRAGRLASADLEAALTRQRSETPRRRIGEILREQHLISEQQLTESLGEQFGIPVLAVIPDERLDPALVQGLPVDWARSHAMLPLRDGDRLCAVLDDPARLGGVDDLALLLGQELSPVLSTRDEVLKAIEKCYFSRKDSSQAFIDTLAPAPASREPHAAAEDLLRMADQAPVTQLVNLILLEAVKQRASDIHLEPFKERLVVRYRIDGFLYERPSPPKNMEAALTSRLKVMARLDIAEKRLPQDGMASVRVGERTVDIRVSTLPVAEGERVVLRLLNRESTLLPLTDLGMGPENLAEFRRLLKEPNGIILVTGPTGSGKTTTLYAGLQELDTDHLNVMTIEDPIEYQLPRIGQMQVKPKIGLTFAQGLRHILRQDPDVILVGEIRDLETAEIAVRAALTGHLVFSTLHTNDASSAMIRLRDMGIEPYLLGSAVKGVLAQRLVRKLCVKCRKAAAPTADELAGLGDVSRGLAGHTIWAPAGCPDCLGGYRGRTGIYELMVVRDELQQALRTESAPARLRALAIGQGMRSLLEDGVRQSLSGVTSLAEVFRTAGRSSE
jgi:general secretion pathway protein E